MLKRRLISIAVISLLILTCIMPVNAADKLTTTEKADVLYKLSILSGNGTDYNLTGNLTRGEAVVFLVRALGKTDYVNANKEIFKNTGFSDVKSTSSYAPYIGYCSSRNIISGYSNGKFGPGDKISEKQFLSIVLNSLGYKYNTDYNTSSIYNVAFGKALLTDDTYIGKTADNNNYKRANAIEVIYNMLKAKTKGSATTLVESLANDGTYTKDDLLNTGLLDGIDTSVTSIISATPVNQDKVFVRLNESIKVITNSDISIYETADQTKKLSCQIESQTGDGIILKTSTQTTDKSYTVEIVKAVDNDGNTVQNIKSTFTGFKNPRTQTDFMRVSTIDPVDDRTINVFFTQPINVNAEIASQYDFLDGETVFVDGNSRNLTVKRLENNYYGISLTLNNTTFTGGKAYKLKVNGAFTGVYGTEINEGNDEIASFYASAKANTAATGSNTLSVQSVTALSNKTLEVLFNKNIDTFYAKQNLNYLVTGPNNSSISINKAAAIEEGENKGRGVRLVLAGSLDKSKNYELYINFLTDSDKISQLSENKFTFSGEYPDSSDLQLTNAEADNCRMITAVFDKPLDTATVLNTSYYTIIGFSGNGYSTNPLKVIYTPQEDYYAVKLFLPSDKPLQGDKTYKLRVSRSLQYNIGSTSQKDMEYSFYGSNEAYGKPDVSEALIIGKDAIRLSFDSEISEEIPNISPLNYKLIYSEDGDTVTKIPISVIYVDPYTVVLKCGDLNYETHYRVKYETIKDQVGINPRTPSDGQNTIDVKLGRR